MRLFFSSEFLAEEDNEKFWNFVETCQNFQSSNHDGNCFYPCFVYQLDKLFSLEDCFFKKLNNFIIIAECYILIFIVRKSDYSAGYVDSSDIRPALIINGLFILCYDFAFYPRQLYSLLEEALFEVLLVFP